jgi:hypothetical protein
VPGLARGSTGCPDPWVGRRSDAIIVLPSPRTPQAHPWGARSVRRPSSAVCTQSEFVILPAWITRLKLSQSGTTVVTLQGSKQELERQLKNTREQLKFFTPEMHRWARRQVRREEAQHEERNEQLRITAQKQGKMLGKRAKRLQAARKAAARAAEIAAIVLQTAAAATLPS